MDWKAVDQRLIRRGELILDLQTIRNHRKELEEMNQGRPGPRYTLANSYIRLLAAVRYIYQMPCRQLEGYTNTLHRLVPELPSGDYSGLRKRILRLPVDPYKDLSESDEPVCIALDSTGLKVEKAGGWIERKHGKKKRYVKLHFAVRVDTHEVVTMEVTTDDVHDVRMAPGLVDGSLRRTRVSRVYGDAAYDSSGLYSLLEGLGVEVVVKPKANARTDRGHPSRRRAVSVIKALGYDAWARLSGYGRRWAVETAYSSFKRLFGEGVMGRSLGSIVVELVGKVALYTGLVRM
jgi:IS5 family transposase